MREIDVKKMTVRGGAACHAASCLCQASRTLSAGSVHWSGYKTTV